jgi:hypothetical protein
MHKLIEDWDAGLPVWTMKMSEIDRTYELAVQVLAMETLRNLLGVPVPEDKKQWDLVVADAMLKGEAAARKYTPDFTPTMCKLAGNLAGMFWLKGEEIYKQDESRNIQITKPYGLKTGDEDMEGQDNAQT